MLNQISFINSLDLIFTSPPYFYKEDYSGDLSSHKLYLTLDEWCKYFLAPMIKNAYVMLNNVGYMAFSVANFKMGMEYNSTNTAPCG